MPESKNKAEYKNPLGLEGLRLPRQSQVYLAGRTGKILSLASLPVAATVAVKDDVSTTTRPTTGGTSHNSNCKSSLTVRATRQLSTMSQAHNSS
jgi:hypothetical protein